MSPTPLSSQRSPARSRPANLPAGKWTPETVTSVCTDNLRAKPRFAPPAISETGLSLQEQLGHLAGRGPFRVGGHDLSHVGWFAVNGESAGPTSASAVTPLRAPIREFDFHGLRAGGTSGAEDEFHAGAFVVVEIHLVPTGDHPESTFAPNAHVNGKVLFRDAKLFTSAEV